MTTTSTQVEEKKQRRWSFLRKVQCCFGIIGALITIVGFPPIPDSWIEPKSALSNYLFDAALIVTKPASLFSDLIGLTPGKINNIFLAFIFVLLVNMLLGILVGTALWCGALLVKSAFGKIFGKRAKANSG
jgi:hypothetical protein